MLKINQPELVLELLNDKKLNSDSYISKKLLCFRAILNKHSTAEISEILATPKRTITDWVVAWNTSGIDSLARKTSTGRISKLSPSDYEKVKSEFLKRKVFNSYDVQRFIHDEFKIDFGIRWIERILKNKFKFHYSKPYVIPTEQPENAEEILEKNLDDVIKKIFEEHNIDSLADISFGFLDESSPQNRANTSRVWAPISSPVIRKSGKKISANTIGFYAINGTSNALSLKGSKKEDIAAFLKEIHFLNQKSKATILVLDNCRAHHSKHFLEKAKKYDIYPVFLPPYSPNLNPIEFIWKSIKKYISQKNFVQDEHTRSCCRKV